MSDTYQAVYNAARQAFGNCDIGRAVQEAFDISHYTRLLHQDFSIAAGEMGRPSVVFKPAISADGDHWCVLLGENLQTGVAGFGKTPAEAMAAFDTAFYRASTPSAGPADD